MDTRLLIVMGVILIPVPIERMTMSNDSVTHEHRALGYTWGEYANGDIWQAGPCDTCGADLIRRVSGRIFHEWLSV